MPKPVEQAFFPNVIVVDADFCRFKLCFCQLGVHLDSLPVYRCEFPAEVANRTRQNQQEQGDDIYASRFPHEYQNLMSQCETWQNAVGAANI